MYNRYIPRDDGSYQKRPVTQQQRSDLQQKQSPPEPELMSAPAPTQQSNQTAGSFLKNLLPKNFDIGDLIIVLLVLLMAGDCEEDQNMALLTLALYFFM